MASFYGQVSNAHLGVTIDFAYFEHFLALLDISLPDERFNDQGLYGTSAILARLRAVVSDVRRRQAVLRAMRLSSRCPCRFFNYSFIFGREW